MCVFLVPSFLPHRPLACALFDFSAFQTLSCFSNIFDILKKVPQAKWRYSKVLSIFHMSMVIFPYIFHNFHMSGVKDSYKNKKYLRAAPSFTWICMLLQRRINTLGGGASMSQRGPWSARAACRACKRAQEQFRGACRRNNLLGAALK